MHLLLLNGAGPVSQQEGALIVNATLLMLVVAVPVLFLLFFFAWRYRASNTKAVYMPNWEHGKLDELVWWAVPLEIVLVIGALSWQSAHALDPYVPIASNNPPLTVQVVSLDWKWLFIYPAQGIATVNYLAIPASTPIDLELTSDAPMNALWIPALAGQEMTMPGMTTQLNLMANSAGHYVGESSNFSGEGFAGMQFVVDSMSQQNFASWAQSERVSTSTLTWSSYQTLAQPSENNPPAAYVLGDSNLYTEIVSKYMNMQSGMDIDN